MPRPNLARIVSKREPRTTIGTGYRKFPALSPFAANPYSNLPPGPPRTPLHHHAATTTTSCAISIPFRHLFISSSLSLSLPLQPPVLSLRLSRHNFPWWIFRFVSSGDNDGDDEYDDDDEDEGGKSLLSPAEVGITVSLFISRERRYYRPDSTSHSLRQLLFFLSLSSTRCSWRAVVAGKRRRQRLSTTTIFCCFFLLFFSFGLS